MTYEIHGRDLTPCSKRAFEVCGERGRTPSKGVPKTEAEALRLALPELPGWLREAGMKDYSCAKTGLSLPRGWLAGMEAALRDWYFVPNTSLGAALSLFFRDVHNMRDLSVHVFFEEDMK